MHVKRTMQAPASGITAEWRAQTGCQLVAEIPGAVSWDTLDESDDRDVSEFVIEVADEPTEECDVCGGDLLDGDEPGAIMATSSLPTILVCSERCTEVAATELWQTFYRLEAVSRRARRGLLEEVDDPEVEGFGDYVRDVVELHTLAASALHSVSVS